jgi:gas vesicle protein
MMRILKFLAGFMMGLLVGSVLVALTAPQSGSQTQQRLSMRCREILEEARRAAEATRTEAHIRLAELKARQTE